MPKLTQRTVTRMSDEETITDATTTDDPNHPMRWKHRRRMAYIALFSMLVLTAYAVSPWIEIARLEKLSDIIEWFYFAMASIVGAYMGFATWSAKTGRG